MDIEGKLVLITGASSGIGAATAKAIARKGGQVILVARNKLRLDAVVADIVSNKGQAYAYQADLSDRAAVSELIARIRAERGLPDILFNNAGAGRWVTVTETDPGEAEQMMALPYFAAFSVTRELLPAMLARRSGHIVNITSVAARIVWPGAAAYTAARWAMNALNNALRAELHGSGVRVTLAVFGKVSSEYWAHNPGSEQRLPIINRSIPTLTPEQVANAIVRGIETNAREIVRPIIFRALFLLNALFPRSTEFLMRLGWKRP
jgi:uncharacterized protein